MKGFVLHYESAEMAEGRYSYLSEKILQVTINAMDRDYNERWTLGLGGKSEFPRIPQFLWFP